MASVAKIKSKKGTVSYKLCFNRKGYPIFCASFFKKSDAKKFALEFEEGYFLNYENFKFDRKLHRIKQDFLRNMFKKNKAKNV